MQLLAPLLPIKTSCITKEVNIYIYSQINRHNFKRIYFLYVMTLTSVLNASFKKCHNSWSHRDAGRNDLGGGGEAPLPGADVHWGRSASAELPTQTDPAGWAPSRPSSVPPQLRPAPAEVTHAARLPAAPEALRSLKPRPPGQSQLRSLPRACAIEQD